MPLRNPLVLTVVCLLHADGLRLPVREHEHDWMGGKRCISISSFAPLYHVNQLAPQFCICELLCTHDYAPIFCGIPRVVVSEMSGEFKEFQRSALRLLNVRGGLFGPSGQIITWFKLPPSSS